MAEYGSLVEFLMAGADPELIVRGYLVYKLTFGSETSYCVVRNNEPHIVASGKTLSDAVEVIVNEVCLNLLEGVQVNV